MSDNLYKNGNSIILNENDTIVNNQSLVSEIFNEFFMTVASGIGFDNSIISAGDAIRRHKEHSNVVKKRYEFCWEYWRIRFQTCYCGFGYAEH